MKYKKNKGLFNLLLYGAVVRKTALALTLILALLLPVVAGAKLVEIGSFKTPVVEGFISPAISIMSPQNNKTYVDQVPLIFSTTPGGFLPGTIYSDHHLSHYAYNYSLDGQASVGVWENTTLTGLCAGNHSIIMHLTYWIERESGFGVSSETIYFNVEATEPFPIFLGVVIAILVIIATIALVVVIPAKLLVYYRKNKQNTHENSTHADAQVLQNIINH